MKVSIEWLKEFVDIDLDINELARKLTEQGVSVEAIELVGDNYIFDLEITPNRPDLLSVFGIAREIKALERKDFKRNPFEIKEEILDRGSAITVDVEDGHDCQRYTGCFIEDIKIDSSPNWMKNRLEWSGIRSLNNVIDVTNYVLLEMGHPLHAFTADTIKGNKIKVRRAKNNESIVTLDGITRKLDGDILVIADVEKPIALAGIMGSENSGIQNETKNIFIESAYFNPTLIRKGARKLKLTTESSFRFERKADINALIPSLLRAKELIIKLCKGKMKGGITDIYKGKREIQKRVYFSIEWLNGFLGSNLSKKEITEPLTFLGFKVKGDSPIEVEIPSFRRDIERKEDIAEEVIRMVGFETIPKSNEIRFDKVGSIPENSLKIKRIKTYFTSLGYDEAINISFVSAEEVNSLKIGIKPVAVLNPITNNLTHLRPALLLGLLKTMKRNINIGIRDIRLFEIGNVFLKDTSQDRINEPVRIAGIITGKVKKYDWRGENRTFDYFDLKGDIEGLFDLVRVKGVRFEKQEDNSNLLDEGSIIYIDEDMIGIMGSLSEEVKEFLDIPGKVLFFEIGLLPVLDRTSFDYKFVDFPRYPAVLRDICLLVPDKVTHNQVEEVIKKSSKGMVESIQLFDTYYSKEVAQRLRSLTYSLTFRSNNGTLNDKEVNETIDGILKDLNNRLGVKLRGRK